MIEWVPSSMKYVENCSYIGYSLIIMEQLELEEYLEILKKRKKNGHKLSVSIPSFQMYPEETYVEGFTITTSSGFIIENPTDANVTVTFPPPETFLIYDEAGPLYDLSTIITMSGSTLHSIYPGQALVL